MIRLILAEDDLLTREGLARLLSSQDDLEIVAVCNDYDGLLDAVAKHEAEVVLTDIRMPPTGTDEGIRAARLIRSRHPGIGIVVLSQHDEAEYALSLFEDGSAGRAYLLKERVSDLDQLLRAIREVAQGGSVIDPKVVDTLVAAKTRSERSAVAALTPRETEILAEMAQGKTNAAIAQAAFLTEKAVEKHIGSIFSKLGLSGEKDIHRRVTAVLLFLSEKG